MVVVTDREQVRWAAEHAKTCANFGPDSIDAYHALAESVIGILAELEQAERERDEAQRGLNETGLLAAERLTRALQAEARLAKVPALVQAVRALLAAADEAPDDWMYEAEELEACRSALAAYEQEQEAAHQARGPVSEGRTRRSGC